MAAEFDPYREWLQLDLPGRKPNYYELLGLPEGCDDRQRIQAAAMERIAHVRRYQAGRHSETAIGLMNEISQALTCLSDPASRTEYDRALSAATNGETATPTVTAAPGAVPPPPPVSVASPPPPVSVPMEPPPVRTAPSEQTELVPIASTANRATSSEPDKPRAPSPPAEPRNRMAIAVAGTIGLAALLAVTLIGYGGYRLMVASPVEHQNVPVPQAPRAEPRRTPVVKPKPAATVPAASMPAEPNSTTSGQAPQREPPARPNPSSVASSPPVTAPPAPEPEPTASAPPITQLQPGLRGSWEGMLVQVYLDPDRQQARFLLQLDAKETLEAVGREKKHFDSLLGLISDAELPGKADRVRIIGTAQTDPDAVFSDRTHQLVIQVDSLERTPGTAPAYVSRGPLPAFLEMNENAPLALLFRMKVDASHVYLMMAKVKSNQGPGDKPGAGLQVMPSGTDVRAVDVQFPGHRQSELAAFQPGDDVLLQATIAPGVPPNFSLIGLYMRKANQPGVQIGTPQQRYVDVAVSILRNLYAVGPATGVPAAPTVPGIGMTSPTAGIPTATTPPAATAPAQNPSAAQAILTIDNSYETLMRLAWSADGTHVAAAGQYVWVWKLDGPKAGKRLSASTVGYNCEIRFCPQTELIALTSNMQWNLYNYETAASIAVVPTDNQTGFQTAFTPDGRLAFIAAAKDTSPPPFNRGTPRLAVWNVEKGQWLNPLEYITKVAVSSDGRGLLAATPNALVTYRLSSGKWSSPLRVNTASGIMALWWVPGLQNHVAALAGNGQLGVWNIRNAGKPPYWTLNGISLPLSWSHDGKQLVALTNGVPVVHHVGKNLPAAPLAGPAAAANALAPPVAGNCTAAVFNPRTNLLALGHSDGRIFIRDEDKDREVASLSAGKKLLALEWSPQGDRLASAHQGEVRIWDINDLADSPPK